MPKKPTHTDYRIIGKLHYSQDRVMTLKSGMTLEEAKEVLSKGFREGWLDPYAVIRRAKVLDTFKGVDLLADNASYYELINS